MKATILLDQFIMLASSVSSGFPKPSTERLAKSSGVSSVEPMMNTKIGAIRKCCEHGEGGGRGG